MSHLETLPTRSGFEHQPLYHIKRLVSDHVWKTIQRASCDYKTLCGVPYTALPIATCISADHDIPMLIRRKEAKDYGTKKMIEGHYVAGDKCLIIEDVVTSGSSVLDTVKSLNEVGLLVSDAIVLLDRGQGGKARLKDNNIDLHSVCSIDELLEILQNAGKLSSNVVKDVQDFISSNNTYTPSLKPVQRKVCTYSERASICHHPLTKQLFTIMNNKKTNLALSADVTTSKELLNLADTLGPYICVLKTHVDILEDFSPDVTTALKTLAFKHNFIIFEDRKFADIGSTVHHQLSGGVYRISQWADLINAHALPGPGVIDGLKQATQKNQTSQCKGCLLIAEMSSQGSLATGEYTKRVVDMAAANSDFVLGFISQSRLTDDPQFIHMTPGVKLEKGGDSLGQQYETPNDVITRRGSDVIIVGRGIIQAPEPAYAAKQYQEAGYAAYRALFE